MSIPISETEPRHFGTDDLPICETCKSPTRLTRRTPHPLYGIKYELQYFECRTCGREIHRSADAAGFAHNNDACRNKGNTSGLPGLLLAGTSKAASVDGFNLDFSTGSP